MSLHSRFALSISLATLAMTLTGCRGGIEVRTIDPSKNVQRLAKAADAIVKKFPEPTRRAVAATR